MGDIIFLRNLSRHEDLALLALRVVIGAFLVWGVRDNVMSPSRMAEFATFLGKHGFPSPTLMAKVSVYVQLGVGVAFIAGVLTRWAGLLCAANFIVALVMVDRLQGIRGMFPAAVLVL
ncbi:MAG: DoxX family protein, partial [Pseudomonadota bacterium]